MEPGTRSKLFVGALLSLCLLVPAGCGGKDEAELTNENFAQLVESPSAHEGESVDVVGQVVVVERDDEGVYFYLFADPASQALPAIVAVLDPALEVSEDEYVRVTGTVRQELALPESMSGFTEEPVVLASGVAPVEPPAR